MFRITKSFSFSASHIIEGLAEGHPCGRMHGHNYTIIVELAADSLTHVGFVRDYGELSIVKEWIDRELDHQHLNDVLGIYGVNPTAESIALFIYTKFKPLLPELIAVGVKETDKTWAEFRA